MGMVSAGGSAKCTHCMGVEPNLFTRKPLPFNSPRLSEAGAISPTNNQSIGLAKVRENFPAFSLGSIFSVNLEK